MSLTTILPKLAQNYEIKLLMLYSLTFLEYLTPVNCEFHFAVINNDTILKKISKIKPNKALGLNNISGKLLKDTATVVTPFLNLIFNLSLAEGIFPSDWKNAEYRLEINPEVEMSVAITDQYLFCLQYLRFSKRLFSIK